MTEPGARSAQSVSELTLKTAKLWDYLSSWTAADGGVYGPIVHRGDLKRLFDIHDTPWTQAAVISGLIQFYRRSNDEIWLTKALNLADSQCTRQRNEGHFRWAGHEDDRFSSLVHNALADCALLDAAAVLDLRGEKKRRDRYLKIVEKNLEGYIIGELYRPRMNGFAVNPVDYYANKDRFVVNMNSVAVEAMVRLDLLRETSKYSNRIEKVATRIQSLQTTSGLCAGSFPYSDIEQDTHIPLYTALSLRYLPAMYQYDGNPSWRDNARQALSFFDRTVEPDTGLWCHKIIADRIYRNPVFVSGAGMICCGLLDAANLAGETLDEASLAHRLLQHQYPNGAIRNFIGYDHPDNGYRHGSGLECWEDVYPTPNWNAQSFYFLSRVVTPPEAGHHREAQPLNRFTRRSVVIDSQKLSLVLGIRPVGHAIFAIFIKRFRYAFIVPGFFLILHSIEKAVTKYRLGRRIRQRLRIWLKARRGY